MGLPGGLVVPFALLYKISYVAVGVGRVCAHALIVVCSRPHAVMIHALMLGKLAFLAGNSGLSAIELACQLASRDSECVLVVLECFYVDRMLVLSINVALLCMRADSIRSLVRVRSSLSCVV